MTLKRSQTKNKKKAHNITKYKKKIEEKGRHNLYSYEQEYVKKRYVKEIDRLAQNLPKLIATNGKKRKAKCKTCTSKVAYHKMNGSHWIPRGHYMTRRKERNIHACCVTCNKYNAQEHGSELTRLMIEKYGQERVDEKRGTRYFIQNKPDYNEMLQVYDRYIARYQELGYDNFI